MNKYRNKKTVIDGITFDSQKEANRYCELRLLEKAGEISHLKLQPEYVLQKAFFKFGKSIRAIKYKADFEYRAKDGYTIVEDVKGFKTKEYRIKQKLFEYNYPASTIKEV